MGGHGDHWNCISKDRKGIITQIIPLTTNSGELAGHAKELVEDPESGEQSEETVLGMTYPQADLRSMVVEITDTKNKLLRVRTGYPAGFAGIPYEVEIAQIHNWENYGEALIEGSIFDGPWLCFFDTFYFQNKKKYQPGMKLTFALCALAYSVKLYEHEEFEVNNPKAYKMLHPASPESHPFKVSFDGAKLLIPHDQGDKDDYSFQTTIEELEKFNFLEYPMYRFKATFMDFEDQQLRFDVYAGEHVFQGFEPKVGDEIRGVLWLQGRMIE